MPGPVPLGGVNSEFDALEEWTAAPPCPTRSALRALCAFEAAGEDEAFCRRHFLHFRNLREAAALHKQLARTLEAQQARQARQAQQAASGEGGPSPAPPALAAAGLAGGAALPPPPPGVLEALRKALAAGWADQVARRIRSIDYLRSQEAQVRGVAGLPVGSKAGFRAEGLSCCWDHTGVLRLLFVH